MTTSIEFIVKRDNVYLEVAKTTAYCGSKRELQGQEGSYDIIASTDEDEELLDRFWSEAWARLAETTKRQLSSVVPLTSATQNGNIGYRGAITYTVSPSFDSNLKVAMEEQLFSYLVNSIVGQWFDFANAGEAEQYKLKAVANLQEFHKNLCYKKMPARPTY